MMISIITAPRKSNEWYFAATLDEVERQIRNEELAIVVDGVSFEKRGDGNREAFFYALSLAADSGQDLLYLEDDLKFCKNAIPYMCDYQVPRGIGWVQFFTPGPVSAGSGRGLHTAPPGTSMFNQCLKFSSNTARKLVEWNKHDDGELCAADSVLRLASRELGIPWASHRPDLVQHIGEVSVYDDGRRLEWWRVASDWPGEDFDAMELKRGA